MSNLHIKTDIHSKKCCTIAWKTVIQTRCVSQPVRSAGINSPRCQHTSPSCPRSPASANTKCATSSIKISNKNHSSRTGTKTSCLHLSCATLRLFVTLSLSSSLVLAIRWRNESSRQPPLASPQSLWQPGTGSILNSWCRCRQEAWVSRAPTAWRVLTDCLSPRWLRWHERHPLLVHGHLLDTTVVIK